MRSRRPTVINELFIEDLLSWKSRREVFRGQPYHVWTATPTKEFWGWRKAHRAAFEKLKITVGKDPETDDYQVVWWREKAAAQDATSRACAESEYVHSVRQVDYSLQFCSDILRPYQVPAAGTLMDALQEHQFALDVSETGLGKTFSSLAAIRNLGLNFGVVCPASVVSKWTNTSADVFGMEPEFVLSYDRLRAGKTDYVTRGKIVRGKKVYPKFVWNTCDKVVLVFDEIHVCSGTGSLNSALLKGAVDNQHVSIIGLSATAANSPLNMQVLGYALGLHTFWNWYDWCRTVGCRDGLYGGLTFDAQPGSRAEASLKKVHRTIFPARGVRLVRSELKDQLPKDLIVPELVDLAEVEVTKPMHLALDALELKVQADEDKAEADGREVAAFTTTLRDRQRSEILKSSAIAEKALHLVESGYSVAVFIHFTETINLLSESLKSVPRTYLVGGMSRDDRDGALDDFRRGVARVILCQMQAGSTAVDLHNDLGNFPRASIINPGYSARELVQALGRINRDGSADAECLQYLLFAAEGVEQRAAASVQSKINNLALLNDGDLGAAIQVL